MKYAIAIIVVLSLMVGAYFFGHHVAALACIKTQQDAVNAQHAADLKAAQDELQAAQDNAKAASYGEAKREAGQSANKQAFKTITQTVTKYVHDTPSIANCGLDAAGLSLWNGANAGTAPAKAAAAKHPSVPAKAVQAPPAGN